MGAGTAMEGSGRRRWVRAGLAGSILLMAASQASALEPGEYRLPFGRNAPGLAVGPETPTGMTPVVLFLGETVRLRLTVVEPADGGLRGNGDLFFGSGGVAYDLVRGPVTIRPLVSFDTDHDGFSTMAGVAVGIGF